VIVREVLVSSGWSGEQQLCTTSGRPIDATLTLDASGLRHGQQLHIGGPGVTAAPVVAGLRVVVVNGPDAGKVTPLNGMVTIGRALTCDLVLSDIDVSRHHITITPSQTAVLVSDLGSTNGTSVNGLQIGSSQTSVGEDDLIRIGDSTLQVRASTTRPAALRGHEDGATLVDPAPRADAPALPDPIHLPIAPSRNTSLRRNLVAAVVPVLAAVVLAVVMHSPTYLIFGLLSPLSLLAAGMTERTSDGQSARRARREYGRLLRDAHRDIGECLCREARMRRWQRPDPASLAETACVPGVRLWTRRRRDADLLMIRIGLRNAAAALQVQRGATLESAGQLDSVPAECTLADGALGVAAPSRIAHAIGRWSVAQLAVSCSPADLQIVPLLAHPHHWSWLQWLPHVDGRLALDHRARSALVAKVVGIAEQRRAQRTSTGTWSGSWLVVFIDSTDELHVPELDEVLENGAALGISAIFLARDVASLPPACHTVVRATTETGSRVAVGSVDSVIADQVSESWAEHVARSLARLRAHAPGDELPTACDVLALHEAIGLDVEDVLLRWKRTDHAPVARLGVSVDGPLDIDLVRDGPHALVAGTTGAGKSELLRAWIASLALLNPPEDVAFVLVDYKGGAAFAECAALPHTTGVVTDLDHREVRRVLTSLGSELQRREMLFARAGVTEWAAYRARDPDEALPRLVVVVDEFAGLATELPDFVAGLVSLAQRGRSLGIHLILATQRPGGVVSPEIRANTSLRIALRTTSAGDSADVIDSPAAEGISARTPGRAILLTAGNRTAFQAAFAGAPARQDVDRVRITRLDEWRTPLVDQDVVMADAPSARTQLAELVDVLSEAALRSARPSVRRPWLPPLPSRIALSDLPRDTDPSSLVVGLADRPGEQRQTPVAIDVRGASIAFVGSAQSGRSTALRTLALSAASTLGPHDLQIHTIDSGGLSELSGLPHLGTTLSDRDPEVVERFLSRLGDQCASPRQQDTTVMLLVDDWERFVAADDRSQLRLAERILELARGAASSRLVLAVAGDRDLLSPRIAAAFGDRFILPLNQREDYALAGVSAGDVPFRRTPGRAIDTDGHTVQFAHAGTTPESRGATEAVARIARKQVQIPPHTRIVVRSLPRVIDLNDLPKQSGIVLGVGGDACEPIAVDLFAGARRLLIAGAARTGRTTLLRGVGVQAEEQVRVAALAPPRSTLATFAETRGWELLTPGDTAPPTLRDGDRLLLLVDDAERFTDTPIGDLLSSWLQDDPENVAAIVAGRTDELAITYRGLAAEIRRSRVAVLLQPSSLDGELVGTSLPRQQPQSIPGRGVLVGDPAWDTGQGCAPIPIQVAAARG
jgi:S-DNA-T family DNA segregation ATPase FtsK/SpoIIIE